MRKIINKQTALVLMLVFALSLIGCGAAKQTKETSTSKTKVTKLSEKDSKTKKDSKQKKESETEETQSETESEMTSENAGEEFVSASLNNSSAGAGYTTSGGTSGETAPAQTQEAYFDRDKAVAIFNAINAERAANGIGQLAWSEDIYNFACGRAQTIVNDFSHNGCGSYGENIHKATWVESANETHTAFYNSPGHHANYLNTSVVSGAVAVYIYNGGTYCVENFAVPPSSSSGPTVVETWTASNGVTLEIWSDGQVSGGGADMDMLMAAMDEYFACH